LSCRKASNTNPPSVTDPSRKAARNFRCRPDFTNRLNSKCDINA
jgi:hypothetical protein